MKSLIFILALCIYASCTAPMKGHFPQHDNIDPSEGLFPIRCDFVDIPAERRIELHYTNNLNQAICLYPEQWIGPDSDRCVLLIGQLRFPIKNRDTGYCPGCSQLVAPGETVSTSFPYDDFHVPDSLFNEEKHLSFTPLAFRCR